MTADRESDSRGRTELVFDNDDLACAGLGNPDWHPRPIRTGEDITVGEVPDAPLFEHLFGIQPLHRRFTHRASEQIDRSVPVTVGGDPADDLAVGAAVGIGVSGEGRPATVGERRIRRKQAISPKQEGSAKIFLFWAVCRFSAANQKPAPRRSRSRKRIVSGCWG